MKLKQKSESRLHRQKDIKYDQSDGLKTVPLFCRQSMKTKFKMKTPNYTEKPPVSTLQNL